MHHRHCRNYTKGLKVCITKLDNKCLTYLSWDKNIRVVTSRILEANNSHICTEEFENKSLYEWSRRFQKLNQLKWHRVSMSLYKEVGTVLVRDAVFAWPQIVSASRGRWFILSFPLLYALLFGGSLVLVRDLFVLFHGSWSCPGLCCFVLFHVRVLYFCKREESITFPADTKYFNLWSGLSSTEGVRVW